LLARQVADDQPLMEAGLDSLGSVDLRNILAAQFSVELPSTVMFDYPIIPALARFITSLLATQGVHSNFESAILPSILPSIDSVR
jgi:acyl carrier protein